MDCIEKAFVKIGARVKIRQTDPARRPWARQPDPTRIAVDVLRDRKGREFFDILVGEEAQPEVIDVRPELRHLVMMVRDKTKAKYLCGHDERHWFCAAVPGSGVSTVNTAIRNLRPEAAYAEGVRRQGEWFFRKLTASEIGKLIGTRPVVHLYEPISRGAGSKPHVCQEVVRHGGTLVWVSGGYPAGLTQAEYETTMKENPDAARWTWRQMTRDARVFARGSVRHADHATIRLLDWHEVYLNNERLAPHSKTVAFLD